jgi:hypothetical protein
MVSRSLRRSERANSPLFFGVSGSDEVGAVSPGEVRRQLPSVTTILTCPTFGLAHVLFGFLPNRNALRSPPSPTAGERHGIALWLVRAQASP